MDSVTVRDMPYKNPNDPRKRRMVSEKNKRYRKRSPETIRRLDRQKTAERYRQISAFLTAYRATHPCMDCGETDPDVLEFDHRDPATKKFGVTRAGSLAAVKREIAKCDIRCANCHARKTAQERRRRIEERRARIARQDPIAPSAQLGLFD